MENLKIKNKIQELENSSQEVLQLLLSDTLLEMGCRDRVSKDILKRLVLVYLSLFGEENYFEYDDLNVKEKNIICRIISKGIASIYVDEEYITDENTMDRLVIIEDLIDLLCFLTGFCKSTIKRLVIRDIKIYFYAGWKWDFI